MFWLKKNPQGNQQENTSAPGCGCRCRPDQCPPAKPPCPPGSSDTGRSVEALSAYSTPPQAGSSGGSLIFDRNAFLYGDAVSHDANSSVFTVRESGVYEVSFHGSVAPAGNVEFPLQILLYLQQQGMAVPGTAVRQSFEKSSEVRSVAFSQIINVSPVPAELNIASTGGSFIYSDITLTILKIGNIPESDF